MAMLGRSRISAGVGSRVRASAGSTLRVVCRQHTLHACTEPRLYYYPGPRAFHVLRPRPPWFTTYYKGEKSEKMPEEIVSACMSRRVIISAAAERAEINFSARLCTRDVCGMATRTMERSHRWRITVFVKLYHPRCTSLSTQKQNWLFLWWGTQTGLRLHKYQTKLLEL